MVTFWRLLVPSGSPFGSILVPWPPRSSLVAPQGAEDEKSNVLERKTYPFWTQNGAQMDPKWYKNEAEIDIDFGIVFVVLGTTKTS